MPERRADTVGPSPWIAVAGLLMLGTVFLLANPLSGTVGRMWPWELFQEAGDNLIRAVFLLWVLTGVLALSMGLGASPRTRALVLLPLGAMLVMACSVREAGFTIGNRDIDHVVLLILLGAGLLAVAGGGTAARPGRWLAGLGGLLYLWVLAANQDPSLPLSQLEALVADVQTWIAHGADEIRPDMGNYLWVRLLPSLALAATAVGGVLIGLGVRWKPFTWTVFALLLLALIAPAWFLRDSRLINTQEDLLKDLQMTLIGHGFALWLLCTTVLRDALRTEASQ